MNKEIKHGLHALGSFICAFTLIFFIIFSLDPSIFDLENHVAKTAVVLNNQALDNQAKNSDAPSPPETKSDAYSTDPSTVSDLINYLKNEIKSLPDPKIELSVDGNKIGKSFPDSDTFSTSDITLTVSNYANTPAKFTSLSGLEAPFGYKGGNYPGIGGTCGATINKNCKIVLTFKPRGETNNILPYSGNYLIKYGVYLTLDYSINSQNLTSSRFSVTANSKYPASIVTKPETTYFGSSLGGNIYRKIFFSTSIKDPDSIDDGVIEGLGTVKNITVDDLDNPFTIIDKKDCQKSVITQPNASCSIKVAYKPDTASKGDSAELKVHYFDGIENKTYVQKLVGSGILVPDNSAHKNLDPKNILLVYNSDSNESKVLKDYYIAHRPGFSKVNVLAIHHKPIDEERITKENFNKEIKRPIQDWVNKNPDINPPTIVFMRGVPTGVGIPPNIDDTYEFSSVSYRIGNAFESHATFMDMGSLEASKAYIDKLANMYNNMKNKNIIISAQHAKKGGDKYYFEDSSADDYKDYKVGFERKTALEDIGTTNSIIYNSTPSGSITLKDVTGFFTWGYNTGRGGDWPLDKDQFIFTGNSNWYIIDTVESYNGYHGDNTSSDNPQSNWTKWFRADSFGGRDYSATPVGAVVTVEEPMLFGKNNPEFFTCWEKGGLFSDCAYESGRSPTMMAVGDPWIKR